MKKFKLFLAIIGIAFITYSCAASCGPGPGQSIEPIKYPSGYTIEKKGEIEPSK